MNLMKSVGAHVGLTALAALLAFSQWTKKDEPIQATSATVQVWSGKPDQLESVSFESKDLKVHLQPKKDELGRYYVVNMDKVQRAAPPPNPHAPPEEQESPPETEPGKHVKSTFVSVTEGNTLAESLASLSALRALGRIDKDREEEFGFDKPEGTLTVKLAGQEHKLAVGGLTPGGGDRYVRLSGSNEGYAVLGEALRGVLHPESRLLETQLHGFDMTELRRVKVSQSARSRELLRLEDKADGWANLDHPKEQDETAGNWMTKVSRLRVSKYVEGQPKGLQQNNLVVRIDYFDGTKTLGFLELFKLDAPPGGVDKSQYLVRTEHTRWYGEVLASMAEQVETDLSSVLTPPKAK